MWISQQFKTPEAEAAAFGIVSISGEKTAVLAEQEHRELLVLAPQGLFWRPMVGAQVLMQDGCVLGCPQSLPEGLEAGELLLQVGGCSIRLKQNGQIRLTGQVYLNDQLLGGGADGE